MPYENELVKNQYANDRNLLTRINLHEKYSVNKQGFGNWIFDQYQFKPGMRILELGCGNGGIWPERIKSIPERCELILSDVSSGMLEAANARVGNHDGLTYHLIDIMDIPYEDHCFDVVIANMMLYHVPDIDRALAEVRRVLKQGGTLYCATYGENGLVRWLNDVFCDYHLDIQLNTRFTLQNGKGMLEKRFEYVRKLCYSDAFEILRTEDLVSYLFSMTSTGKLKDVPESEIFEMLNRKKTQGVIHIPKEYGMFAAS